jgi:hypothetical protein
VMGPTKAERFEGIKPNFRLFELKELTIEATPAWA